MMLALFVSLCIAFLCVLIVRFYTLQASLDSHKATYQSTFRLYTRFSFTPFARFFTQDIFIFALFFTLSLCLFGRFDGFDTPSFFAYATAYLSYAIFMFLGVLALIDMRCLALPDLLNFIFLFLCVSYGLILYPYPLESIMFGFGVGGIAFVLKIFYQSVSGRDIIGEADIVLLSALGIAYGVFDTLCVVFSGSVIALLYMLVVFACGYKSVRDMKLPFVLFVFIGQCLNQFFYLNHTIAEILAYA